MLHFTFKNMRAFYGPWPRGLGLTKKWSRTLDTGHWTGGEAGVDVSGFSVSQQVKRAAYYWQITK